MRAPCASPFSARLSCPHLFPSRFLLKELPRQSYYCATHILSAALSPDPTRTPRQQRPLAAARRTLGPCISCTTSPYAPPSHFIFQLPALSIRVDSMKCTPLPSGGARPPLGGVQTWLANVLVADTNLCAFSPFQFSLLPCHVIRCITGSAEHTEGKTGGWGQARMKC